MSFKSAHRGHKKIGWLRHVLTGLSALTFIAGALLLGYMGWVLATSVSLTRFLSGTLVFTYSAVGVGFLFFLTGLVGWIAGASELRCVLKSYFVSLAVAILVEVAGIVALNILGTKMEDILVNGWAEVNQGTRNIVQGTLNCCGFYGPREFAYTSYPIDDSCYESVEGDDISVAPLTLKQSGCGPLLQQWFTTNRAVWCSLLAGLGGLQLMSAILCLHIINKLKDKTRTPSLKTFNDPYPLNYAYSL
ncbi:CD82 antigen-like [Hyalella azteca]|uniref:CD82 antigen-like n=1 Tax=Hyalella azteca TaxID=294128 RepID=A0A8B7N3N6_HYAAZ|nr:CD82 antigen-like [Hyalella azteca]